MYLGIDIGGTKTLVALLGEDGRIQASQKFPTPQDYQQFLQQLANTVRSLTPDTPTMTCAAVPGEIDRQTGAGLKLGNLPWVNVPIKTDLERLLKCPVLVENDAKLGALAEANLIKDEFKKVLYVTISTGIGYALVVDGVIDDNTADLAGHVMKVDHNGQQEIWESFASGKAITEKYGKMASEIDDPAIWAEIVTTFAPGLLDLIEILQPQVIIFGGGVGANFDKFGVALTAKLKETEDPMLPVPQLRKAQHAEQAVIYGCYDYIKQNHGNTTKTA